MLGSQTVKVKHKAAERLSDSVHSAYSASHTTEASVALKSTRSQAFFIHNTNQSF